MKHISIFLLALLSGCASFGPVDAIKPDAPQSAEQRRNLLVGLWFGDSVTKSGGRKMHIVERYADGTMRIRFRVIEAEETIEQGEVAFWGISGPVYFSITKGWIEDGKIIPADPTQSYFYDAYEIINLTKEKFRYRHFSTGNEYEITKVDSSFEFPE
jgi:hypothetical protein